MKPRYSGNIAWMEPAASRVGFRAQRLRMLCRHPAEGASRLQTEGRLFHASRLARSAVEPLT